MNHQANLLNFDGGGISPSLRPIAPSESSEPFAAICSGITAPPTTLGGETITP